MDELFELKYEIGQTLVPNGTFFKHITSAYILTKCDYLGVYSVQFQTNGGTHYYEVVDHDVLERHAKLW